MPKSYGFLFNSRLFYRRSLPLAVYIYSFGARSTILIPNSPHISAFPRAKHKESGSHTPTEDRKTRFSGVGSGYLRHRRIPGKDNHFLLKMLVNEIRQ